MAEPAELVALARQPVRWAKVLDQDRCIGCHACTTACKSAEGGLGGEGTDRVAGFWRMIGLSAPAEPDHLAALLGLYATLGEAAQDSRRPATAAALTRARHVLLAEHLWPWLPGYLDAVADLGIPALADWAHLAGRALLAEYRPHRGSQLPLAQRAAPPPVSAGWPLTDMLDALTAPVHCGFILTRRRLAAGPETWVPATASGNGVSPCTP